jgi:ATP-dependent RNA helicase DDX18/HAS1
VGRTARAGGRGSALLFLLPSELGFLRYLKHAKVPLNEYQFPGNKIANVQTQLEKLVEKNYYLNQSAREGYRSYLQAYASHSHKNIFDVNGLDLQKVAKAYGFSVPPKVNINIDLSLKSSSKRNTSSKAGYVNKKKIEGKEHFIKQRQQPAGSRQWTH